jgi:transmembrane protein EpsG
MIKITKIALSLIFLSLCFITSIRNLTIGADTDSYYYYFTVIQSFSYTNYMIPMEPGFKLLYKISLYFSNKFSFFLFLEFLLFNLTYIYLFYKIIETLDLKITLTLLFSVIGFSLLSNWYLQFSLNGLRQGLSTPFLYLSLLYFHNNKYLKSILFFLISISFHTSALLLLPFYLFIKIQYKKVFLFYLLSIFLYITYINKSLFYYSTKILNISFLYKIIIEYSSNNSLSDSPYVGPILKFILYTISVPIIIFLVLNYKTIFNFNKKYYFLLKFYMVLCLPYFFFAYGPYTNRIAIIAWFFTPIMYAIIFSELKLKYNTKFNCAIFILSLGLLNFTLIQFLDYMPTSIQLIYGNI